MRVALVLGSPRSASFARRAPLCGARHKRNSSTACDESVERVFCFGSGFCASDLCTALGNGCAVWRTSRSINSDASSDHTSSDQQIVRYEGELHPVRQEVLVSMLEFAFFRCKR